MLQEDKQSEVRLASIMSTPTSRGFLSSRPKWRDLYTIYRDFSIPLYSSRNDNRPNHTSSVCKNRGRSRCRARTGCETRRFGYFFAGRKSDNKDIFSVISTEVERSHSSLVILAKAGISISVPKISTFVEMTNVVSSSRKRGSLQMI